MKLKFLLFFLSCSSYSQIFYCTYSGGSCASGMQNPTALAQNITANICNVLNIAPIPIYQSSVSDACAFADIYGNKIITYNPNFLNYLYSNNQWAPISVIAHEVGHHYSGHSTWYGTFLHSWTRELQADFVSGYVLYKLGCPTAQDALSAMNVMFTYNGTSSHPDTPKRMDALVQGYVRASQGY